MKATQSRQKNYAANMHKSLLFEEGDHVILKVIQKFGLHDVFKTKKLCLRYIGKFEIIQHIDSKACQLAFPSTMSWLHDVFHVSRLKMFVPNPYLRLYLETMELKKGFNIPTLTNSSHWSRCQDIEEQGDSQSETNLGRIAKWRSHLKIRVKDDEELSTPIFK